MKCGYCGNTEKFVLKMFEYVWTEVVVDVILNTATDKSEERELNDSQGWDGIYCAECDTYISDEDVGWAELDKVWEVYNRRASE